MSMFNGEVIMEVVNMKDKSLIYYPYGKGTPMNKLVEKYHIKSMGRVKILWEDGISYYVESLDKNDKSHNPMRFSCKKHFYVLRVIEPPEPKRCTCKLCPQCGGRLPQSSSLCHRSRLDIRRDTIARPLPGYCYCCAHPDCQIWRQEYGTGKPR